MLQELLADDWWPNLPGSPTYIPKRHTAAHHTDAAEKQNAKVTLFHAGRWASSNQSTIPLTISVWPLDIAKLYDKIINNKNKHMDGLFWNYNKIFYFIVFTKKITQNIYLTFLINANGFKRFFVLGAFLLLVCGSDSFSCHTIKMGFCK